MAGVFKQYIKKSRGYDIYEDRLMSEEAKAFGLFVLAVIVGVFAYSLLENYVGVKA